jgi:hypothetical protein
MTLAGITFGAESHQIVVAVDLGIGQEVKSFLNGKDMSNRQTDVGAAEFAFAVRSLKNPRPLRRWDAPDGLERALLAPRLRARRIILIDSALDAEDTVLAVARLNVSLQTGASFAWSTHHFAIPNCALFILITA